MYSEFKNNMISHLLVAAVLAALLFLGKVEVLGLVTISVFWVSIRGFAISKNMVLKLVFFVSLAFIALGLSTHMLPGFNNILLMENYLSGEGAATQNKYLNFDKSFLILFLVDYYIRNKQSAKLMPAISYSMFLSVATIAVLAAGASYIGYIKFSPKIPPMILTWIMLNLMVSLSEEALFRAFCQKNLGHYLSGMLGKNSEIIALFLMSILFGLAHCSGGIELIFLAFVAGLAYGYALVKTKRIEASILTHFMVNLFHILFFTHPYAA